MRPDLFDGTGRLEAVHVTYRDGVLHIGIDGILPRRKVETLQESVDLFRDYMVESLGEPVAVEVEAIPLDSFRVVSGVSR